MTQARPSVCLTILEAYLRRDLAGLATVALLPGSIRVRSLRNQLRLTTDGDRLVAQALPPDPTDEPLFQSRLPTRTQVGAWARRHSRNIALWLQPNAPRTTAPVRRVLVVDDEPVVRSSVRRLLTGHTVVCAASAAQARELLCGRAPDLILLDVWMPVTTGLEFLAELAQDKPHLAARVCLMTAAPESTPKTEVPLLHKPFGRADLDLALALVAPASEVPAWAQRAGFFSS